MPLEGLNSASFRASTASLDGLTKYSVGVCIARNYAMFLTTPVTAAAVLLALLLGLAALLRAEGAGEESRS